MFYIIVVISIVCHIILYLDLVVNPKTNAYMGHFKELRLRECMELIGSTTVLALGWLVMMMMNDIPEFKSKNKHY